MTGTTPIEHDSSHNPALREEVLARLCLIDHLRLSPAQARWLAQGRSAVEVIETLRQGRLPDDVGPPPAGVTTQKLADWTARLRNADLEALVARHHARSIGLLIPGDPRWPFDDDPEPPLLVFFQGDLDLLKIQPGLAVVGTRRCTSVGRTVAYEFGAGTGQAGVVVVSGLALGVDGAAHRGALDSGGPVIGVVGSGLDVVYPGANRGLWNDVIERGLLLSEAPAEAAPARWRFPARNRLIAGLSSAVVVVESHRTGGALLTVDEAVDRGLPVMAVPGSVLSPASDGTNELLVDGAIPVRNAADALGHLGVDFGAAPVESELPLSTTQPSGDSGHALGPLAAAIMAEITTGPVHLDRLIGLTGRPANEVLAEVQSLASAGRLILDGSTVALP